MSRTTVELRSGAGVERVEELLDSLDWTTGEMAFFLSRTLAVTIRSVDEELQGDFLELIGRATAAQLADIGRGLK